MNLGFYNTPKSKWYKDHDENIILVGVSYDKGSRFTGAKNAPDYLRNMSKKVFIGKNRFLMKQTDNKLDGFYNHQTNNFVLAGKTVADYGNFKINKIKELMGQIGSTSIPIIIGGDHTITYYVLSGLQHRKIDRVFYFDAHEDTGEKSSRCKNNNVVTWIKTLKNVSNVFQLGLRGYSCNKVNKDLFEEIFSLNEDILLTQIYGSSCCYISIDVDVLDPFICPAVSTPVMNGFSYQKLKSILAQIISKYNVIGIDIVEFVPKKDRDCMAGLLILDLILYIFEMIDKKRFL